MFKIKYIKGEYVQTSGSALLKMMQNNTMPVLDLFVREAIQNSLDAAIKDSNGNNIFESVDVDFNIGSFERKEFSKYFDDIKDNIDLKFSKARYDFLSVRDSNTIGLVGNKNGKFKKDGSIQNLGKLVFQIMHPQDQEGSGGSWGIGKTIYYRLGKGFTVFYSRIRENNVFEERLVASLVEDEDDKNSIMYQYEDGIGIAFFGNVEDNECSVITDSKLIHEFLSVFGIEPFDGEKTGTLVLIPFIDQTQLLNNNKMEFNDEHEGEPFWYSEGDISTYLKYAIYRWYFPRMSKLYPYGAYLNASINNNKVCFNEYDFFFKKYTEMYEALFKSNFDESIKIEPILRKRDLIEYECGKFIYTKVNRDEMGMNLEHLPSPFTYVNMVDVGSDSYNTPLVTYIRKPGMLISYKTDGDWAGNGVSCNDNEFILGLFVLNSNNEIKHSNVSLEEYIRKGEKSDHIEWFDHALDGGKKIDIVKSITRGISTILKTQFSDKNEDQAESTTNRVFGKRLAKLVLPDHNYGNGSSVDDKGRKSQNVYNSKQTKINISNDINYEDDFIKLKFNVTSKKDCEYIEFKPRIATSNGYIDLDSWVGDDMPLDFVFDSAFILLSNFDDKKVDYKQNLTTDTVIDNYFTFKIIKTNNICTSFKIISSKNCSFSFNIVVKYRIINKNSSFVIKTFVKECEEE